MGIHLPLCHRETKYGAGKSWQPYYGSCTGKYTLLLSVASLLENFTGPADLHLKSHRSVAKVAS